MNRIAAIAAVAVALRLAVLIAAPYPMQDDTRIYLGIGGNLLAGWGYSFDNDGDRIPEIAMREPGYPTLLAALLTVAPSHAVLLAALLQILAAGAAVFAVFALGRRIVSPAGGVAAAWLYALWPALVVESTVAGHEGVLIALIPVALLTVVVACESESLPWFAVAGVALAATFLFKQTAVGVAGLTGLGALAANVRSKQRWVGCVVMGAVFVVAVSPWVARMIYIRQRAQQLVVQLMPQAGTATMAELRERGLELHHGVMRELRESQQRGDDGKPAPGAPSQMDQTILARVTYEFYESDPRRVLPILSGSGGEVQTLVQHPSALVARMAARLRRDHAIAVFMVPYENRYIERLLPATARLSSLSAAAPDVGTMLKLFCVALLLVVHLLSIGGLLRLVRRREAWPVLAVIPYFYLLPFVHTAPLNRFFFLAIPIGLVVGSAVLTTTLDPLWRAVRRMPHARWA